MGLADHATVGGQRGDVIAVDGDPLTDISALERIVVVMKGGEIFKGPGGSGLKELGKPALSPSTAPPRHRRDGVAALEWRSIERLSGETGLRVFRLYAGVLDSIVRDQIRKSVIVYVSKVIVECVRPGEIM